MVAAGKKAALARATGSYTFDQHLKGKPQGIKALALVVNDFVAGLDASIQVVPKKRYVAYKTSQNIVCLEVQQKKLYLFLKLDPKRSAGPKGLSRDVSQVGHYGTGDLEITLTSQSDLDLAKPFIKKAYEAVGG